MSTDPRKQMGDHIQHLLDRSSNTETQGSVYIIYQRIRRFRFFPGSGNSKSHPTFKHWMLVILIGDERIRLHFGEITRNPGEGMVHVSPYIPRNPKHFYFLGHIVISTEKLYSDIQDMFTERIKYSIKYNNCQHFVRSVIDHFKDRLSDQDPHMEQVTMVRGVTFAAYLGYIFSGRIFRRNAD